jgi:hypothetical protein
MLEKSWHRRFVLLEVAANEKMATAEQMLWCDENESYIWRYFIDKQLYIVMI